jgi:hypothetical protein
MPHFAANLSWLLQEVRMLDRFHAARELGFEAVECQFPYGHTADELAKACQAVDYLNYEDWVGCEFSPHGRHNGATKEPLAGARSSVSVEGRSIDPIQPTEQTNRRIGEKICLWPEMKPYPLNVLFTASRQPS